MIILEVIDEPSAKDFNHHVQRGLSLVQFHSPKCGHCNTLKPIWKAFVNKLKSECKDNLLVAKVRTDMMDRVNCDKNIPGVPTIYVLDKGKKKMEYEGERSKEALLEFARSNLLNLQEGGRRKRTRRRRRRRGGKKRRRATLRKRTKRRRRRRRNRRRRR